jgi:hypothetical protein
MLGAEGSVPGLWERRIRSDWREQQVTGRALPSSTYISPRQLS